MSHLPVTPFGSNHPVSTPLGGETKSETVWPSLEKIPRAALVVFSGGQDSTTCLHWALRVFARVEAVFFDYGQRHATERESARAIAAQLQVPLREFRLGFFAEMGGNALVDTTTQIEAGTQHGLPNTFVPGRNILFLTQAAAFAYTLNISDLVTGVCQTDFSGYPDCRDKTLRALEAALNLGLGWPERHGQLQLHTPLMFLTKAQTITLAQSVGALGSLALSHTCYEGRKPPCGVCPACVLRAKGFAEAGLPDPLLHSPSHQ